MLRFWKLMTRVLGYRLTAYVHWVQGFKENDLPEANKV